MMDKIQNKESSNSNEVFGTVRNFVLTAASIKLSAF
jgi:hypothetical protein